MKPLPKQYDHKEREKYWQDKWLAQDAYRFHDDLPREQTFVIDTPPPTVSGVLHMGHIFSYTQADFVARYQRMAGKDVFYPMGFDDNGLPTERLVEKIKEKKASQYPTREAFIADCREVVKGAEEEFRKLFKSAALSVDWHQEYQTISDDVRKLSQASFLDLLKKGEAYRDFRPTYWDWVDQTAIAQAEIENKELPGTMNDIQFTLEDGTSIVIATTRPELLGACVAVMYHPEDPNAGKYKGKFAITPLFGVKVPMIADELVERDKGTGLVMCCTFGDDTDKEWWRKYKLPLRPVLGKDGKVDFTNQLYVESFKGEGIVPLKELQGLKPKQANAKMIELLQADGKILKQTQIVHTVKCAERSGTPIEIIPTYQWFVSIINKKDALLAKGAECVWHPEYMRIRLNQWIEGLKEDWCISRQRFFGVPFPVWYVAKLGSNETVIVTAEDKKLPVDPMVHMPHGFQEIGHISGTNSYTATALIDVKNSEGKIVIKPGEQVTITPDKDVMDTWATSSISPQINARSIGPSLRGTESDEAIQSGSPRLPAAARDDRFKKLFPADLRPQAHEIIRTWAFYTIVKAHLHADSIPWENVMISGWCLAADKTKMSKSKGNIVTPVALIEDKGSDAVRYWASTSRLGTDTAFSEDLLKIGKKLVTKLWNASNFAAKVLEPVILSLSKDLSTPLRCVQDDKITEALDLWILSRLKQCIEKATKEFERFEYCDARVAMEDFFWNDFCDNYLELVKARAYGEPSGDRDQVSEKEQQSALCTIYHCLETLLRLFAPFVPHITEELYSHIFDDRYTNAGSVHARGQWPNAKDYPYDAAAERSGIAAVDVLNVIRKAKSEAGVSIKFPVRLVEGSAKGDGASWEDLQPVLEDLKAAGNAKEIREAAGGSYTSEKGWFSLTIQLADAEAA